MTRHPVYRVLHLPKTILGVDVTLGAYAGAAGVVALVMYSPVAGVVVTGLVYGLGCVLVARDSRMIEILWSQRPARLGGVAGRARYDAAKWSE
jgi:type IV secretory pathway VirB3-like protein